MAACYRTEVNRFNCLLEKALEEGDGPTQTQLKLIYHAANRGDRRGVAEAIEGLYTRLHELEDNGELTMDKAGIYENGPDHGDIGDLKQQIEDLRSRVAYLEQQLQKDQPDVEDLKPGDRLVLWNNSYSLQATVINYHLVNKKLICFDKSKEAFHIKELENTSWKKIS